MKEADVADTVQAVLECSKGRTLREKHKDTIKAFIQVGVFLWLEELEAEICRRESR